METRTLTHKGTTYVIEVDEMRDVQGKDVEGTYICHVYSPESQRTLKPKGNRHAAFVRHAGSAKALLTELEDEILTDSLEPFDSAEFYASVTTRRA